MILKVGDCIRSTDTERIVVREILKVRKTGYQWRYPEIPEKTFMSENSNDPFFEWGWEKISDRGDVY